MDPSACIVITHYYDGIIVVTSLNDSMSVIVLGLEGSSTGAKLFSSSYQPLQTRTRAGGHTLPQGRSSSSYWKWWKMFIWGKQLSVD